MLLPTNIDAASTHSIFRSQQQWQARDLRRDVATGLLAATQWQWVNIWDGVDCRELVGQLKDLTPLRWKNGVMSSVIETWSDHEGDRLKVCNTPRTTKILE